jgi:hypothetical protein
MHDTKERLSFLWIFALLNYLYAVRASPSLGSDGFSGLDGDTHRYDSGVETFHLGRTGWRISLRVAF